MVVLFDMDGTLVPMNQDSFTRAYFKGLCTKAAPLGYEPKALVDAVWKGTVAMIKNDGKNKNSDVFWAAMKSVYGEKIITDMHLFDEFYENEFDNLKSEVGYTAEASAVINRLKKKGVRLVLASNPVFPALAQTKRVGWAGIDASVFERVTSYENSSYCKPNPEYYTEIVKSLGVEAKDCLMIGNDASDDLAAAKAGLSVFLLTDGLINTGNVDISKIPHGGYKELNDYLDKAGL